MAHQHCCCVAVGLAARGNYTDQNLVEFLVSFKTLLTCCFFFLGCEFASFLWAQLGKVTLHTLHTRHAKTTAHDARTTSYVTGKGHETFKAMEGVTIALLGRFISPHALP